LRGEITEIGGLKEKLLAALRGGIRTVLIPETNAKDLQEIPDNVKAGLTIIPVRWIDQVLEHALVHQPVPLSDETAAVAAVIDVAAAEKPATPVTH
jgi:ATP-dependent Lon protease